MRPLILHNVPDDELYTGEDGIQRPYAMIFPGDDRTQNAPRARRPVTETGSFGKSSRRSRSRTGSLPPKREDVTMQSADKIFADYISSQEMAASGLNTTIQRKPSYLSQSSVTDDTTSAPQPAPYVKEPREVILRGYRSTTQQYAAINHYEQLAGRVCEDYPREPPIEQRRYKSELRDPAYTRRQPLTKQESKKVNQVAGGEHWIKVTFESAEAADAAIYASPQKILGHLVYAEPYHGAPPKDDTAIVDMEGNAGMLQDPPLRHGRRLSGHSRRPSQHVSRGGMAPGGGQLGVDLDEQNGSPRGSQSSTQTIDTATMSNLTGTASTATVTGAFIVSPIEHPENPNPAGLYCRKLPAARRAKIMPAEQALLPQPGVFNRVISKIPLIKWFSGSMIGDEVPRTESGEFDFTKASLYWQLMYYLDYWLGIFGHELVDKDDEKDD